MTRPTVRGEPGQGSELPFADLVSGAATMPKQAAAATPSRSHGGAVRPAQVPRRRCHIATVVSVLGCGIRPGMYAAGVTTSDHG